MSMSGITKYELFATEGPYDPRPMTLDVAIDVMAATLPEHGSFRQALRTAADKLRALPAKLAESEERRVTARRESDAALARLHDVTAQRDAAIRALRRYQRDGNLPANCPECGGESLCDGCEDGCALHAADLAVPR